MSLLVAVAAAAVAIVSLLHYRDTLRAPRINEEMYHRLTVGMDYLTLKSLIGAAPGDYTTRPVFVAPSISRVGAIRSRTWMSDEGCIVVVLDPWGRIKAKEFRPVVEIDFNSNSRTNTWFFFWKN